MSEECDQRARLRSPFLSRRAAVRVPESQDAASPDIYSQLLSGAYKKPFLVEESYERSLCFRLDGSVQSTMDVREPDALLCAYTRKMMAFLLFKPQPHHILMIGLGGGSLLKFCYRHVPSAMLIAVEIDPLVIAMRDEFAIPADGPRLRVFQDDGGLYLVRASVCTDVLLVDAFDRDGISSSVTDPIFFERARGCLSNDGIFVMNFFGHDADCRVLTDQIRRVFGDPVIGVPMQSGGNCVVIAFRDPPVRARMAGILSRANRLRRELGLEFPTVLRSLAAAYGDRTTILR